MSLYEDYFRKIEAPEMDDGQKVLAIELLTSTGKELQPSRRRLAEEFAPRFEKILHAKSPKVRAAIVKALGSFGIKFYAASIVPLLDDEDGEVRGMVVWALDQLDARQYRFRIEKLKYDSAQFIIQDEKFQIRNLTVSGLVKEILEKWDFIDKKKDDF